MIWIYLLLLFAILGLIDLAVQLFNKYYIKPKERKEMREKYKMPIPEDLHKQLKELQSKKKKASEGPIIKYSISVSDDELDTAKKEIKKVELEPSFREVLFSFIDNKGLTDPEVYKKAKVDKRTFSRIRTGEVKYISKKTVICLGLALELNKEDFDKLLKANHDVLSDNEYFDIAIKWCIKNKKYDIEQVNDILYACDLELLTK